ncbi:hypothetical protein [Burkholderia sp. ABCPW 111]|uniref:hypothetical protein n=1 Tax=Burkholderia sp. ABCPW 111 TaxID=1820025 RepID=UPI00126A2F74|nr:hypothetical protein [Burkholderia sp. ABCPW 111]
MRRPARRLAARAFVHIGDPPFGAPRRDVFGLCGIGRGIGVGIGVERRVSNVRAVRQAPGGRRVSGMAAAHRPFGASSGGKRQAFGLRRRIRRSAAAGAV